MGMTLTSFPGFSLFLRERTLGTRLRLHGGSLWTLAQRKKYNRWVIFNFPKRSWQFPLESQDTGFETEQVKMQDVIPKSNYILIAWIKSVILKIDFRIYLEIDI